MSIYDKRRQDQKKEKAVRKESVLPFALDVLLEKGISETKMTDVANRAQIGVASLYRYYKTKPELVIRTAEYYWRNRITECYSKYLHRYDGVKPGPAFIRYLLEFYVELFDKHPQIIHFIEDFDGYIVREKIESGQLADYGEAVREVEIVFEEALSEAVENKSIRRDLQVRSFAHTAGVGIRGICQKYISQAHLIPSDSGINGRDEILLMIQVMMEYLSPSS